MKIRCEIARSGGEGSNRRYETYVMDTDPTETVLGLLIKINHQHDASLSFRFSCGVIKCGECAIQVNGSPCLACEKIVETEMKIEPLDGLPLFKDLVTDRRAVLKQILDYSPKLAAIKESAILRDLNGDQADKFVRLTKCFECLICQSTCPILADGETRFVGPLGLLWLAQMALHNSNRSALRTEIDSALGACIRCGACSDACVCDEDILGLAIGILEGR